MKTINELKDDYSRKKINKHEFVAKMYDIHRRLFEYSKILKETDISNIQVNDGQVIMTFRDSGVKMLLIENDVSLPALTALNHGNHEKEELEMVLKIIRKNLKTLYNVFDIGANIGWFALHIASEFRNSKTFAFEPIPYAYNCMMNNIQLNKLKNIKAYNFGLADKNTQAKFYCELKRCSVSASMINITGAKKTNKIISKIKKLDDVAGAISVSPDFIKCDVEGAELLVLKGGLKTIQKNKPIILIELLRKWAAKYNYHPNDIIDLLDDIGYRCYKIKNGRLIRFYRMNEKTAETNFFFLYPGKHRI